MQLSDSKDLVKTALRFALFNELEKSISLKWTGRKEVLKQIEFYEDTLEKYSEEWLHVLKNKLGRKALISWVEKNFGSDKASKVDRILQYGGDPYKELGYVFLEAVKYKLGSLGKEKHEEFLIDILRMFKTVLIDLPDYSKENHAEMFKDLREIQKLWEEIMLPECFDVNFVLFVQKELFKGNFFYGKVDVYEIRPLTPQQFDFYIKNFAREFIVDGQKVKYSFPFENDAFFEIARLSRGIFRRFKKYIRICLENWYEELEAQGR